MSGSLTCKFSFNDITQGPAWKDLPSKNMAYSSSSLLSSLSVRMMMTIIQSSRCFTPKKRPLQITKKLDNLCVQAWNTLHNNMGQVHSAVTGTHRELQHHTCYSFIFTIGVKTENEGKIVTYGLNGLLPGISLLAHTIWLCKRFVRRIKWYPKFSCGWMIFVLTSFWKWNE